MAGRRRARPANLRSWRQKIDTSRTLVSGSTGCSKICYGYRFPSYPGRIKIGYSSRGLKRIADQSTAFPETPELVFVIHDPRALDIEKEFHRTFAPRQSDVMGTEWFDISLKDLLRESPRLRRAAGLHRGGRWLGRLGALLGMMIAAWLTPIAFRLGVLLSGHGTLGTTREGVVLHLERTLDDPAGLPADVLEVWMAAGQAVRTDPLIPVMTALPVLVLVLARVVRRWRRRRRGL